MILVWVIRKTLGGQECGSGGLRPWSSHENLWGWARCFPFPDQRRFSALTSTLMCCLWYPDGNPLLLPAAEATGHPGWLECWEL